MHESAVKVTGSRSEFAAWRRGVSLLELLVAGGVFVLAALVAPDGGITSTSMRQGAALAAVFAAAPIAALTSGADEVRIVALGGGMIVAGAATTPGGNLLGPVMAALGLLFLLVGAVRRPPLSVGLVGRLAAYAIALGAGMWLAINTDLLNLFASIIIGLAVATSPLWDAGGQSR